MRYLAWPTLAGLAALAGLYVFTHNTLWLYEAITLAIIECALSVDNAVVNATKLKGMSPFMRRIFTTFGMLVAVGGMRFFLPLLIVKFIGQTTLGNAWDMALHHQSQFSQILASSHSIVAGFGGAFLMMTALDYFCNADKDTHWLLPIEPWMQKVGEKFRIIGDSHLAVFKVAVTGFVFNMLTVLTNDDTVGFAALAGLGLYLAVTLLKHMLEAIDDDLAKAGIFVSAGIGTLIYLEVLDASFSFDGVIAAFAISSNIFVVAIGLGIGALFIRTMTVKLVEAGTLETYKYLENGAYWSILALSLYMGAGLLIHIPDWLVAGTSIFFIVVSALHSVYDKNKGPTFDFNQIT